MKLDEILMAFPDREFLKADGYDNAVIGFEDGSNRLIYSIQDVIDTLMADGMESGEAAEFFWFNVHGSYVGDKTPIWCWDRID